jgi:hypothetical protein
MQAGSTGHRLQYVKPVTIYWLTASANCELLNANFSEYWKLVGGPDIRI